MCSPAAKSPGSRRGVPDNGKATVQTCSPGFCGHTDGLSWGYRGSSSHPSLGGGGLMTGKLFHVASLVTISVGIPLVTRGMPSFPGKRRDPQTTYLSSLLRRKTHFSRVEQGWSFQSPPLCTEPHDSSKITWNQHPRCLISDLTFHADLSALTNIALTSILHLSLNLYFINPKPCLQSKRHPS